MPVIFSKEKVMKARIDEFYGNASVYRPNKFLVGLYGEYVENALRVMGKRASNDYDGTTKLQFGESVYSREFARWKKVFCSEDGKVVELKWACESVKLPTISSKTDKRLHFDSVKSIKYPFIQECGSDGKVDFTIKDDKNMMWYQFFNALNNQFYNAQILKPKSSFQKVGIYVVALQESFVKGTGKSEITKNARTDDIDAIVNQVFEFNSAVLTQMGDLTFSNSSKDILELKVTFDVPDTFQGSFNDVFRGLRDNTSSTKDAVMFDKKKQQYIHGAFTINESNLKTPQNGTYPE